jgi:hypothetical protein
MKLFEEYCLLGCDAQLSGTSSLTFWRNVVPPSSGSKSVLAALAYSSSLKMEAIHSSETSLLDYLCITSLKIVFFSHCCKNSNSNMRSYSVCKISPFFCCFIFLKFKVVPKHLSLKAHSVCVLPSAFIGYVLFCCDAHTGPAPLTM